MRWPAGRPARGPEFVDLPHLPASPKRPVRGLTRLFAKLTDGLLYGLEPDGTETAMGGSGGSVATDAIWDVSGDLAVGTGANTAARLAIGAAGGAVSRVNGAVAWNSGTAFPTAATGDRYWRTDLGLEFYYDGTRWLSETIFDGDGFGAVSSSIQFGFAPLWHSEYAVWLLDLYTVSRVNTTNNGSNYYNIYIQGEVTTTVYGETTTSADSANAWVSHVDALDQAAGSTERLVNFTVFKNGTPGAIDVRARFTYRLIVT